MAEHDAELEAAEQMKARDHAMLVAAELGWVHTAAAGSNGGGSGDSGNDFSDVEFDDLVVAVL